MKNKIIILGLLTSFTFYKGQVGINTTTPGSTLDVRGSFATPYKNVSANAYALSDTDQYLDYRGTAAATWTLPAANTLQNFNGRIYEIRNGSQFDITLTPNGSELIDVSKDSNNQASFTIPAGSYTTIKSTGSATGSTWAVTFSSAISPVNLPPGNLPADFSLSILGYIPKKSSQRVVPSSFSGKTVTERGCKKWDQNGHVYCGYQLSGSLNFYDTFLLAKQVGGYIVTMTSDAERAWVNTNILATNSGYNFPNNIWIGYNKVTYPGNGLQFTFITDEKWKIDWTAAPNSRPEAWFNDGEPNNDDNGGLPFGGPEGSCHITPSNYSSERKWNDLNGGNLSMNGAPFDQVIIEFNEE